MSSQPAVPKLSNIAVLIDADNASAKNIGNILAEIEKLGSIRCKKIYGDWGSAHIKGWQEALLKFAIEPMQQFAYVKGKNATDIGMVIEAMDLLHSADYDGFCLVSSDSDFTSLAIRIRKSHVKVFGFGRRSTVSAFTQACDGFFYVEDLISNPINKNASTPLTDNSPSGQWSTQQLQHQVHIAQTIDKIISTDHNAHNGWSNLSFIASQIRQNYSNIQIEKYGFNKFSDFIIALRTYDIRRQDNGIWVKPKQQKTTVRKANVNRATSAKSQTAVDNKTTATLLLESKNSIFITSTIGIDTVLYRLTGNGKVRGDEDMIFYGQTHSEDNSIEMSQQDDAGKSLVEFRCDLDAQPKEIQQLDFVLSSELDRMQSHSDNPLIKLTIASQQGDEEIEAFTGDFDISDKSGASLLLLTLRREDKGWRIKPMHKSINSNLQQICEQYGIEISND